METTTEAKLLASQPADSVALLGQPYVIRGGNGEDEKEEERDTIAQSLMVGTYAYQQTEGEDAVGKRHGTMDVVQVTRTPHSSTNSKCKYTYSLSTKNVHDTPAVLDLVSLPLPGRDQTVSDYAGNDIYIAQGQGQSHDNVIVYAACAESTLMQARLETVAYDSLQLQCKKLHPTQTSASSSSSLDIDTDKSTLNLSVHATHDDDDNSGTLVVTSDSKGYITLRRVHEDENKGMKVEVIDHRKMHDGEAWTSHIAEIRETNQRLILSGGDDGVFTAFVPNDPTPCWRLRRAHDCVGVTTIGTSNNRIWTGGYDDTVRVWDIRQMRTCVAQLKIHGGVWRVRFHPDDENLVLVPAMYHGCAVVRWHEACEGGGDRERMGKGMGKGNGHLTTVCEYKGHESIAYGAEWVAGLEQGKDEDEDEDGGGGGGRRRLAITASFYDRAIRLWSFDEEGEV